MQEFNCPLCFSSETSLFAQDKLGSYYGCSVCCGVFRDPKTLPTSQAEKSRYLSHNNSLEDQRYLNFLKKLTNDLVPYLRVGMRGLDFGCGPVKAMEHLFSREKELSSLKIKIESYDPFFVPQTTIEDNSYDFILASEVVEHLFYPGEVFPRFEAWLRKRGYLAIMTQTRKEERDFLSWSYRRDPTHVFFFHEKTIRWICQNTQFDLINSNQNQFILQKT